MSVLEKLYNLQTQLKISKDQFNSFGKYNYRNCEQILSNVKPFLENAKAVIILDDKIIEVGDRIYVEATATLTDIETGEKVECRASAREAASKKGMDDSQVTGSTSSYARKYALGGLLAIDEGKDADSMDNREESKPRAAAPTDTYYECEKCASKVFDSKNRTAKEMESACVEKYGQALCPNCAKSLEQEQKNENIPNQ